MCGWKICVICCISYFASPVLALLLNTSHSLHCCVLFAWSLQFIIFLVFFSVSFGCFASKPKQRVSMFRMNRNKQKTHPNSIKESIFGFFRKFRVVSVCFGLLRNSSFCFGCVDIGSKHRNKQKFLVFGFTKQTETNAKQILFWFVSVRT